ncbi:MAG TPA: hypothetical protein VMJ73_03490, partial [Rhizomicrobium sp.]|nr:hypothetical protein [Rhizomicrobium sp.]
RHTHASQMIAAGMDVVTLSRLGHADPAITLGVYAHRFKLADGDAGRVFDSAFGGIIGQLADENERTFEKRNETR